MSLAVHQRDTYSFGHSILGFGWATTYEEHLRVVDGGVHGRGDITWIQDDGAEFMFKWRNNRYEPEPGRQDKLTYSSDVTGSFYILTKGDQSQVVFQVPSQGSRRARLHQIRLARHSDSQFYNVRLEAEYYRPAGGDCDVGSSGGLEGSLCKVYTTNGRMLYFRYQVVGGLPRLASVHGSQAGPALATYHFGTAECGLPAGSCAGDAVCCVKSASGQIKQTFQYEPTVQPIGFPRLKQVTDSSGAIVEKHTWLAGELRVANTQSAEVQLDLAYGQACTAGTGTVVTNHAAGSSASPQQYCLTFGTGASAGLSSSVEYISGSSCAGECDMQEYNWTPKGIEHTIDRLGSRTNYKLDFYGRVTAITEADNDTDASNTPPAQGRRLKYDFSGKGSLPTREERISGAQSGGMSITFWQRDCFTSNGVCMETSPLVNADWQQGYTYNSVDTAFSGYNNWYWHSIAWRKDFTTVAGGALDFRLYDGPLATEDKVKITYYSQASAPNDAGRPLQIERWTAAGVSLIRRFGEPACGLSGYDVYRQPNTMTDENGNKVCLFYDADGRLIETRLSTEAVGTSFSYAADGSLQRITSPSVAVAEYEWNGGSTAGVSARLLSAVTRRAALGGTLLSRRETEYFPGPRHRNLVSRERELARDSAIGSSCTASADCSSNGSVVCTAGACVAATCTSHGQCSADGTARCGPDGSCLRVTSLVEYEYDDNRRLKTRLIHRQSAVEGTTDATRGYTYDALGRLADVRPEGDSVPQDKYSYDPLGRVVEQSRWTLGEWRKVLSYTYDPRGNPSTIAYWDAGVTPPTLLSTTSYKYDDFDRLVRVDSPDAGVTAYLYDDAGNIIQRKASGGGTPVTTSYTYDSANRPTLTNFPTDTDVVTTWDETTAPSVTNCRTSLPFVWPTSRQTAGRISSRTDASGTNHFTYDNHGRVTAKLDIRTVAGETCARVWEWNYDAVGRLITRRYPTGRVVEYSYSGIDPDRPSSIRVQVNGAWVTVASEIRYGAAGEVRRYTSGNGVVNSADFFLDGTPREKQATLGASTILERNVATTAPNGSPTSIRGPDPRTSETFYYDLDTDGLNLAKADEWNQSGPGLVYDTQSWAYENSNRDVRRTQGYVQGTWQTSITHTYFANTARIQTRQGADTDSGTPAGEWKADFAWTAHGAIASVSQFTRPDSSSPWTSEGAMSATYDEEGRTRTFGATHSYDSRWLRTRKTNDAGIPSDFFYDDSGELVAETGCADAACTGNRAMQEYIWLGGALVALVESSLPATGEALDSGGAVKYVHAGLLGEPRRVTDASGNVLWRLDVAPFGLERSVHVQQTVSVGGQNVVTTLAVGFPGQYFDSEMELHYNWHRFYAPDMGMYTQADPLLSGGLAVTPFSYANGTPLMHVDPDGQYAIAPTPLPLPPPAWPVVAAGAVGVAIGLGVDLFVGDAIQRMLTSLLPVGDSNAALTSLRASTKPSQPPVDQYPLRRGDPEWKDDYRPVNAGSSNGKCNPCPPPSPYWWHEHENGEVNCHRIEYDQSRYPECRCYPKRTH